MKSESNQLLPGQHVYVNGCFDLGMDSELAPLIGRLCRVIRVTEGGLYEVFAEGRIKKYSIPKKNLDPVDVRPALD